MKRAYRHSEPKKPLSKPRKKRASKAALPTKGSEKNIYSHPIFHTSMQGKLGKYVRPFDPVWPVDEPELWPESKAK